MQRIRHKAATIVLLCFILSTINVFAGEDNLIGDSVIKPQMTKIEASLVSENFDGEAIGANWANMTRVQQSDGNYVGKIAPDKIATLGLGKMWLSDFTARMNFKLDYFSGNWVEVLDIKYKNENEKGKIMLVDTGDNPRLIFQTVGQASNLWYTYNLPADNTIFSGEWQFLKVIVKGNTVLIYLNSETEPVIEAEGFNISNAAIGFKPFASTLYIDNLILSHAKDLPEVTVKPDLTEKTVLAHQDFEEGEPSFESGFVGGSVELKEDETAYSLSSDIMTGDILGRNYDIEFNLLADYNPNQSFTVVTDADEMGNGYRFNFGSDADGKSTFEFLKITAGGVSFSEVTQETGSGPSNWADADCIWAYFKIEKRSNIIKVYFNNKEKPAYIFTDSNPKDGGCFRFEKGSIENLSIDNFSVATEKNAKRVFVKEITDENIILTSSYPEQKTAGLMIFYIKNGNLSGTEIAEVQLNGSINDGRAYAETSYSFNKTAFAADEVKAYVIDKSVDSPSDLTAEVVCNDNDLAVMGSVGGFVDGDVLIYAVCEGKTQPAVAEIIRPLPNGDFTLDYEFKFGQEEGDYKLYIYDGKSSLAYEKDFQYLSNTSLNIFIDKLNNTLNNSGEFDALIKDSSSGLYLRRLGVLLERFNSAGGFDNETLRVLANGIAGETRLTEENSGEILNSAIFASMVKNAQSAEKTKQLYKEFEELYTISDDIKEQFEKSRDKIEDEIYAGIFHEKARCISKEAAAELFEEQTVLASVYKSGYMDTYTLLEKFKNRISGLDLSKLPEKESERNLLMMKINEKRCYTYAEFLSMYKDVVSSKNNNSQGGSVSGGKPSGGGGGGGGTVSKPSSVVEEKKSASTPAYEIIETAKEITYADVDKSHWAYDYIKKLSEINVIRGYEDEKFYPEQNLSRAELCKLIASAFEFTGEYEMGFSDVSEADWHYPYISAVFGKGLVNGIGDGRFVPDDIISRQDVATILYRLVKNQGIKAEDKKTFADMNETADYAKEAVEKMAAAGILNGNGENFEPKRGTTRAEAAKIIYFVLDIVKGEGR